MFACLVARILIKLKIMICWFHISVHFFMQTRNTHVCICIDVCINVSAFCACQYRHLSNYTAEPGVLPDRSAFSLRRPSDLCVSECQPGGLMANTHLCSHQYNQQHTYEDQL